MSRKIITAFLFFILSIATRAGATHTWTTINNGDPNNSFQQVRVATQGNGQRLLFVRQLNGNILVLKETQPDSGLWLEPPQNLGAPGVMVFNPTPITEADGRVVVFARGSDQKIYYRAQAFDGSFQGWVRLSDHLVQGFTVARNADGRLELFTIESGWMYSWVQWFPGSALVDKRLVSSADSLRVVLAADINNDGRLQVFAIRGAGDVTTAVQQEPGSRGYLRADFIDPQTSNIHELATARVDGRIALFMLRGNERSISMRLQDAPDSASFSQVQHLFGLDLRSGFRATAAGGRLSVFAAGGDTKIYNTAQILTGSPLGPWTNWPFTGAMAWSFDVAPRANHTIDIFAIDTNNRLVQGRQ